MKSFLGNFLDRLFVVTGALLFMQLPLLIHDYQLQLMGHVNELHWQVKSIQDSATKSGKNLEQYIKKFTENDDQDFVAQGYIMKRIQTRWDIFSSSLRKLQNANILIKPFFFLTYAEWDIVKATLHSFEPGLTLSYEGLIYALLGMLFGYLCFFTISFFLKKVFIMKNFNFY